jgi:hypothetical protein
MTFFVPRVNADVLNSGLFSYFGTANYDFDSRFGVTGTKTWCVFSDFLKQIDGVHFGLLQVLEYCRWGFYKIQRLIVWNLGLLISTGNQNILAAGLQPFVGADLYNFL